MSLTVTRESAEASATSASASPGNDGVSLDPSSAVSPSLAAAVRGDSEETSGVSAADDAAVSASPAQPTSNSSDEARAAGRTARERRLTG